MERVITANDLKTKGVAAINEATSEGEEAFITIRGKNSYVVLTIEKYYYLRECELEAALFESKNDLQAGRVTEETVEAHVKRITHA